MIDKIKEANNNNLLRELNEILSNGLYTSQSEINREAFEAMNVGDEYVNRALISEMISIVMKSDVGTKPERRITNQNAYTFSKKLYIFTPDKFKQILEKLNRFYMMTQNK